MTILDFVESPPAIVMELVRGEPLSLVLARGKGDRRRLVALLEKVARALQHAHDVGVVHRDIKPANILVTDGLEPKLADFGLARLEGEHGRLTRQGAVIGSLAYMAPEQAQGHVDEIDPRTDVWALGVILYEILTGSRPFEQPTLVRLIAAISAATFEAPRARTPGVPEDLDAIVRRALARDPAARYPTAGDLAQDLARHLSRDPPPPEPVAVEGYELGKKIGEGRTGSVHEARGRDGKLVAIKLLNGRQATIQERFHREVRIQSLLSFEAGFVPLLGSGVARDGVAYVVMPLVGGGTLEERLARGRLGVPEATRLGVALARALGRAHALGLVHRDVKPANVLFTETGAPLLADLGLAKHFDRLAPGASQSEEISFRGRIAGTLAGMPLEQFDDARSVGPPADVFALGFLLYRALAGAPPFRGETVVELVAALEAGRVPPLRDRRPEVPPTLAAAIEKALAKDPRDRYADGEAFARALEPTEEPAPGEGRLGRLALLALGAGAVSAAVALSGERPPLVGRRTSPPPGSSPSPPRPAPTRPGADRKLEAQRAALLARVQRLLRSREHLAAVAACEEGLAATGDSWVDALRADCLLEAGDLEAALAIVRDWPAGRPGEGRARAVHAFVLERRDDRAGAGVAAAAALALDPGVARAWLVKALLALAADAPGAPGGRAGLSEAQEAAVSAESLSPPCATRARTVLLEVRRRLAPPAAGFTPAEPPGTLEVEAVLDGNVTAAWVPPPDDPGWAREERERPSSEVTLVGTGWWAVRQDYRRHPPAVRGQVAFDPALWARLARAAVASNPHRALSHQLVSLLADDPAERVAEARAALARDSRDPASLVALALALEAQASHAEAIAAAGAALELAPADERALEVRASARARSGEVPGALADLELVRERHPAGVVAPARIALLELGRGNLERAAAAAEAFLSAAQTSERSEDVGLAHLVRARIALARGDREDARAAGLDAARIAPAAASVLAAHARLLLDLGEAASAARAVEGALAASLPFRAACRTAGIAVEGLAAAGEAPLRAALALPEAPDALLDPARW